MHAIHDPQVVALFGGECIPHSYRGRRSGSQIRSKTSRRIAVAFGALLIGFATAATAISIHRHVAPEPRISAGANLMVAPASHGFDAAIY
jgi:hypothetical protein